MKALTSPQEYVDAVRRAFEALGDPVRAIGMRAYMRDQFPFVGIPSPARRAAVKMIRTGMNREQLLETAELLWALPEREYQYAAVDLLARYWRALGVAGIDDLLALAQRDPWWDTVDALASIVSDIVLDGCRAKPEVQERMDRALRHQSMWVRRIAMLHQLGWRMETDTVRLSGYALTLAPEKEFFVRKAIGWALRDYARWNPEWVRQFIMANRGSLSPLSVREGGKHLSLTGAGR